MLKRSGAAAAWGTLCSPSHSHRCHHPPGEIYEGPLCADQMSAPTTPSGLLNQHHPARTHSARPGTPSSPGAAPSSVTGCSPLCQARAEPPPALWRCVSLIPGFHTIFHAGITAPTPNGAWINEGALDLNPNVACLARLPCAGSIEGNLILVGRHS